MVVRKKVGGKWFNVVLDVGKTFRENAAKFFPVWGLKTIDAVVLTHGRESLKPRLPWPVRLKLNPALQMPTPSSAWMTFVNGAYDRDALYRST